MIYSLSLGSNIKPEESLGRVLEAMLEEFGSIYLLPGRHTEPEGIATLQPFVNAVAFIHADSARDELKSWCNALEIRMGRDRNDAQRSLKDRTCDIDIINVSEQVDFEPLYQRNEGYIDAVLDERGRVAAFNVFGVALPDRPAAIYRHGGTGNEPVVDDEANALENWQETGLGGK